MTRRRITGFEDRRGIWHDLRDPDARATGRQLMWLNAQGLLDLLPHPHQVEPISRGEAAFVISDATARGYGPTRHGDKGHA